MSPELHSTACPLDCPDTCSLEVTVDDGKVIAVDGTRRNPYTQGYICGKVRNIDRHMYGKDRVPHPLIRDGARGTGAFRRASWDEALDLIAGRMLEARDRSGGEAILPCNYGGSNGVLSDGCIDERLWRRLGASRLQRDLCAAPTSRAAEGVHGRMLGTALDDYVHSNLIVIWGANPASSGIHHVPIVKEAQKRGARLVVVDPRRVGMAAQADLHIGLRPGTDLPVALSIANWLFENGHADEAFLAAHTTGAEAFRSKAAEWTLARAAEIAGVAENDLLTLATWFAESSPAVVRCGWGLERNRNGGSAVAAVISLPAIAGKFGVRGGGFTMSASRAIPLDREAVINAQVPDTRTINLKETGRALLEARDPAVEVLFVYNANILATAPAQDTVRAGMMRDDLFTVVFDAVMTDTATYADVVLPATTFLEHDDLRHAYGPISILDVRPVVKPVGEARSNVAVFAELVERCGLDLEEDLVRPDALRGGLLGEGSRALRELARDGISNGDNLHPIPFVDAFPGTPDRKFRLHPDDLDAESGGLYVYKPDPATDAYPLALITPSTASRITSTFGQLVSDPAPLEMHPEDMSARGLKDNDPVRVFNDLGEMRCAVVGNPDLPRGTTSQPKGLWSRDTECGRTNNALCPDTAADLGGGACYNDARIEVRGTA